MSCRIAVGILAALGIALASLFFFCSGSPWAEAGLNPIFGSRILDSVLFGGAGVLCVFLSLRLFQGTVWAWWTTLAASILVLGFGLSIFYLSIHPRDDFARSEGGFGIGLSVILMVPATVTTVLLSLPPVRRSFYHPNRGNA
jgi:hypothetical protein